MLIENFSQAVSLACEAESSPAGLARLVRDPTLSHGRQRTGNKIIQAENLRALHGLRKKYAGAVRCIYIDPPYNNKEKYTHYDDDLDHETWVSELVKRIRELHSFLSTTGSLWISIDDSELHYLKVAIDQVFGRKNFITTIVWQQRTTRENRKVFSNNQEYVLVYAKDSKAFSSTRNLVELTPEVAARYKNPDDDPRGLWQSISANVQAGHATPSQFYELVAPNGKRHRPPSGRCWIYTKEKMTREISAGNIWFGRDGTGAPRLKRFLSEARPGLTPDTLWLASEVGTSDSAKKHLLRIFPDHPVFDTPKPEELVGRILRIATDPGDLVLDAYLGSGTTAAVAHKMNRKYIGIEQGEHAVTHCAERLRQVIEGESGGISALVNWAGGGGFDFLRCR